MTRWIRAIADEIKTCIRLTLEPIKQGKRNDPGWLRDRHLRNGFLIAAPVFLGGIALTLVFMDSNSPAHWVAAFGVAIASNLIWLAYAAWSRARSKDVQ